jgi:uncharacterized protein YciI
LKPIILDKLTDPSFGHGTGRAVTTTSQPMLDGVATLATRKHGSVRGAAMKSFNLSRRSLVVLMSAIWTGLVTRKAVAAPQETAPPVYYVLFHTPGPGWRPGVGFRDQPGVMDHVRYMSQFEANGVLVMGGPFLDDSGGMMVTRVKSMKDAADIANNDPTVKGGLLRVTVRPWLVAMQSQARQVQQGPAGS